MVEDHLADFVPFMFNGGSGWIMTLSAESFAFGAYFDESERFTETDPLCVAGFTFTDTAYKEFCKAWSEMLATAIPGRPIPFMHLFSLMSHKKHFDGLDIPTRVKCLDRAVDIVCEHAYLATGAGFDQKEFEELAGPDWPLRFGSSYAALCQRAAQTTATWLQHKGHTEPILYTFEAGHEWEYQTDQMFKNIGRTPFLRGIYQYGQHVFEQKIRCYGAQASDMVAWTSSRLMDKANQSTKSIDAFLPSLARMVEHFNVDERAMVRHLRGDVLRTFVEEQSSILLPDEDFDNDDEPTISVHELRGWFVAYQLLHAGTDRERIALEIAGFIDGQRESTQAQDRAAAEQSELPDNPEHEEDDD